jgi:phage baseplate assembly protein W
MASPTQFQLALSGATWIDSNSQYTQNMLPDRIPDELAISNALGNLFNCAVGERGKIFQPTYGSDWKLLLQEPIDTSTSNRMFIALVQSIALWEPRIALDYANTFVTPDLSIPGYNVQVSGIDTITKSPFTIQFQEQVG